jgi:type VI protein secretion system component Hcp
MNTDQDAQEHEAVLLTDAELDAVAGADFHFVKKMDKASAKLFTACATGEH